MDNAPCWWRSPRQRLAELLGFENYAERQLVDRMAGDANTVLSFLQDLAHRAKPQAEREFALAPSLASLSRNRPDVAYASEQLRKATFSMRRHFGPTSPRPSVTGLFQILSTVFAIELPGKPTPPLITAISSTFPCVGRDSWCHLTYDLFARKGKRAGAGWTASSVADAWVIRWRTPSPVVANFAPGSKGTPPLLTHDEVLTLFHEFGHAVHHLDPGRHHGPRRHQRGALGRGRAADRF